MIKNIIFDFGDIFINLDKSATQIALNQLGLQKYPEGTEKHCQAYEKGQMDTAEFLAFFEDQLPEIDTFLLQAAWNAILLDMPSSRLDFIQSLAQEKNYRLFLLSNTNASHIEWIQEDWGEPMYEAFQSCFEAFYLSHEIQMRKPDAEIFEFVLNKHKLRPEETLFIDDTMENTAAAEALGIKVWNLDPTSEDIVDLLTKKELFT